MAKRTWLLDVAPSGTPYTIGNALSEVDGVAAGVFASGTASVVSDSSKAFQGGLSCKIVSSGSLSAAVVFPVTAPHTAGAIRFYHYMTARSTKNVGSIISLVHAGMPVFKIGVQSSGILWGRDATSASLGTSSTSLILNQWNRFEITYDLKSSGGNATVSVYNGDATTPYLTFNQTNKNFGNATFGEYYLGVPDGPSGSSTLDQWFDVVTIRDGAGGEIGPYIPPPLFPPTISVTKTDPTTEGATDGTITVTAGPSTGAASIEVGVLTGNVTTGEPATFVALPGAGGSHTFTGFTAGDYTGTAIAK